MSHIRIYLYPTLGFKTIGVELRFFFLPPFFYSLYFISGNLTVPYGSVAGELFGVRIEDKGVVSLNLPSDVTENSDPLLDLVITAENPTCDDATLLNIAKTAQFISEVGSIPSNIITAHQHRSITNILPSANSITKKQFLIESSDNDIHGGEI